MNQDQRASNTVTVPGARLYYEVRGSGPVLLLMGAPLSAAFFSGLASVLARDYSVVTYDPPGISRSTLTNPDEDVTPELVADGIHVLLEELTTEPVYTYGTSGGATTGLALVSQYPQQVRTLIAHEPPLPELLPNHAQLRAAFDDVCSTYFRDGPELAWQKFLDVTGMAGGPTPVSDQPIDVPDAVLAERQADDRCFFEHMLRPFTRYQPDIAMLDAVPTRIVVAAGKASGGQLPHRTAAALAEQLHTPLVEFPGDHTGGFAVETEKFAQAVRQALTETTSAFI